MKFIIIFPILVLVFLAAFPALKLDVCSSCRSKYSVDIEINSVVSVVNEKFLSLGFDAKTLCDSRAWNGFNTSSPVLISLSKALSPSFLRFGGTSADYVIFNNTSAKQQLSVIGESALKSNHCPNNTPLTAQEWMKLNEFTTNVGWKLLFGFNALYRKGKHWNPSNAIDLLKFTNKVGYCPSWELGNELNAFHQLQGGQLGKDFITLRNILNSFPCSNSSLLVGPDVSGRGFKPFLKSFLREAKKTINAVTFHHYYFNGRTATLEDFLNVDYFDSLKTVIADVFKVVKHAKLNKKVWLGETSSAYGGGAPGLSDTYVAGFLWLDKLGLSAIQGIDVVVRQTIYHGYYSLLTDKLSPLPNFWLSLLHKWLVGRKVLKTTVVPNERKLRVYAHCLQKGRLYKSSNGVTVFVVNLLNETVNIAVPALSSSLLHQYLLTPPKDMQLRSTNISLNGQELRLNNTELPNIVPEIKPPNSPLILPPFTYGFYVFPNTVAPACVDKN